MEWEKEDRTYITFHIYSESNFWSTQGKENRYLCLAIFLSNCKGVKEIAFFLQGEFVVANHCN